MEHKILMRLVTLITLNTNLDADMFRDTVEMACLAELLDMGLPNDLARALSEHLAKGMVRMIKKNRGFVADSFGGLKPTPDCNCATCRVVKWANKQGEREGTDAEKAAAKELIDKLLVNIKHQN